MANNRAGRWECPICEYTAKSDEDMREHLHLEQRGVSEDLNAIDSRFRQMERLTVKKWHN